MTSRCKQDTDPTEFKKHFWCEKYSAMVHYNNYPPPEWEEKPCAYADFGVLFGADNDLWSATINAANSITPEEKERLLLLLNHPAQPLFNIEALAKQWRTRQKATPHSLLTLYCHSAGDQLSIDGKTITSYDFEQKFVSSDELPPTLVLLAGCNTAVGELNRGFFKATAAEGYCGFIGTEVKVPDIFTLRFVARFFDRF